MNWTLTHVFSLQYPPIFIESNLLEQRLGMEDEILNGMCELFDSYPVDFFRFRTPNDPGVDQAEEHPTYSRTGYAARLIHAILRNSNFSEIATHIGTNLIVGGSLSNNIYNRLKPFTRITHYERTFSLGSKAGYHKLMKEFAEKHGFPQFYPESYYLPEEKTQLEENFSTSKLWISKPGGGARGEGIKVIDQMPVITSGRKIIQKYIDNPMLINGLKFDLRFYVCVTSLDPLMIFVHQNGLVRLATENYNDNESVITNTSAHLTNFSINKKNSNFHTTNDMTEDGTGNKWTHEPFWPWLESQGFDPEDVKSKIDDAFVTVIMASRETFKKQNNHRLSFELFGFDVMFDSEGNIYILEVNVSPALGTSSNLDMYVKAPLVRDFFNIALIPKPSEEVGVIHDLLVQRDNEEVASYVNIAEYELSLSRLGGFRCVYPTLQRIQTHSQFIDVRSKADKCLEAWISKTPEEKAAYIQTNQPKFNKYIYDNSVEEINSEEEYEDD